MVTDENVEIEVTWWKAEFVGTCLRCKEPATGSFDQDEDDGDNILRMKCVNCGFKMDAKLERSDRDLTLDVIYEG